MKVGSQVGAKVEARAVAIQAMEAMVEMMVAAATVMRMVLQAI